MNYGYRDPEGRALAYGSGNRRQIDAIMVCSALDRLGPRPCPQTFYVVTQFREIRTIMNTHFKDEEAETLVERLRNMPKVRRLCSAGKQLVWESHLGLKGFRAGPT